MNLNMKLHNDDKSLKMDFGQIQKLPIARLEEVEDGIKFTVTDKEGTTSEIIKHGTSVSHEWDGTTLRVTSASGTSEADLQGFSPEATTKRVEDGVEITVTDKKNGTTQATVKDGIPATHKWNGTTLEVTTASGTSSADLKGFSPEAKVERVEDGVKIIITDEEGETSGIVKDGFSPTAKVEKVGDETTVTIVDKDNKETTATIKSPTAKVEKIGDEATITLIDENGETSAIVKDGFSPTAKVERFDGSGGVLITITLAINTFIAFFKKI